MDDCGWCVPMNVENKRGDNPQSYHPFRSLVLNRWTHDPLEFHMISPKKHWIKIRMSVTFCHCPHILEVRSSLLSPSRKHTESSPSQLCAWGVQPPLPQWKVSPKLSPPRMGIALSWSWPRGCIKSALGLVEWITTWIIANTILQFQRHAAGCVRPIVVLYIVTFHRAACRKNRKLKEKHASNQHFWCLKYQMQLVHGLYSAIAECASWSVCE